MKKNYLKSLKVFLTLLLLCGVSNAWGESATLVWSEQGFANATSINNRTYNIGTYFTVTCTQNSAGTPPTYYTSGTAVRLYATKNTNNGNIITISTTSSEVYITKVIYNGTHNKKGTTKFNYNGTPTSSDATSATYNEEDKVQTATATLCETGGSENGQFYFTSIEVQYVVKSSKPKYTVTISNDIQNGIVTASPMLAEEGTDITLNATPNAGYTFGTWDVYKTGETTTKVNVSEEKFKMPAYDVTVSATFTELPKHTVTISQPEGATLKINGETDPVELHEGETANISYELTAGYSWSQWTVTGVGSSVTTKTAKNTTFTMGTEDATLSASVTKLPVYTVTFSVNGVNIKSEPNYAGEPVVFPENPSVEGYTFMGWTETPISGPQQTAPIFVTGATYPDNNDKVFYAVFAKKTEGGGNYEKVTTAPADWCGKYLIVYETESRAFNGKDEDNGYVTVSISNGEIADPNGAAILDIATMDGGYSLKITNGENANKYIYGKSGSNSIQYGTTAVASTITFTDGAAKIENNSTYFCYNATSGNDRFRFYKSTTTGDNYILPALYKKQEATYSNYCTDISYTRTVNTANIGTLCVPYAFEKPDYMTLYNIVGKDDSKIYFEENTATIEAGKPYLFRSTEGTITLTYTGEKATEAGTSNGLVGTFDGCEVAEGNYILSNNTLYIVDGDFTCGANRAYIHIDGVSPYNPTTAKADFTLDFNDPTGIESINPVITEGSEIYNLNGMRVNNSYKGIVIVNGKKYINK